MNRPHLRLISQVENRTANIPFSEMLDDHRAILEGYLDTHITRNHSSRTFEGEQAFLTGWFEGILVADENHPMRERQLFVWEAMKPVIGRERIKEGYQLPPKMSWHALRKSFATNYMEQNAGRVWELMILMGHPHLSTLHRYVIPGKETFEQAQNNMVIEMMPNIEVSGEEGYASRVEPQEVARS